jgi:hypothetical protein
MDIRRVNRIPHFHWCNHSPQRLRGGERLERLQLEDQRTYAVIRQSVHDLLIVGEVSKWHGCLGHKSAQVLGNRKTTTW